MLFLPFQLRPPQPADWPTDRKQPTMETAMTAHAFPLDTPLFGGWNGCRAHRLAALPWASLSVSLVRDSEGDPLYFVSQIQDVTERKDAEAALR